MAGQRMTRDERDLYMRKIARADRMRMLREDKGFSQRDLADLIRVTPLAVARWESALSFPQARNLRKLAALYGVSIVFLRTGLNEVQDPYQRRNSG